MDELLSRDARIKTSNYADFVHSITSTSRPFGSLPFFPLLDLANNWCNEEQEAEEMSNGILQLVLAAQMINYCPDLENIAMLFK